MWRSRVASANQRLYEATVRHQVHLLRFSEGQAKRALSLLQEAEGELLGEIGAAMAKGRDVGRLESLLASVKQRRAQVYEQLGKDMRQQLKGLAEADGKWEAEAIAGSSPIQLNLAQVPLEQLYAAVEAPINGIKLDGWLNNIQEAEASKLQQAVSLAFLQGETIDDLVRRIRGTRENGFADGILTTSTRNAQALARTAVNHVSNAAREQVWEANSDIVRALRWTSTLDGRTSPVCQARDGHLTPLGDSALDPGEVALNPSGARPPAHFQCRSLMVAVLDGVAIAGDRPFVADARTRAEREKDFRRIAKEEGKTLTQVRSDWADKNVGRLPAKTTYQDWLRGQPKEFQDELLGTGKAAIFRSGVPLERFVDTSGKALSLEALRLELQGDALNVIAPSIGVKAKGLLLQGASPEEVLNLIKKEYPDAKTTLASIASYKSELNKAGLMTNVGGGLTGASNSQALGFAGSVAKIENALPTGMQQALGGQWYSIVEALDGSPGAYAHYKPGVGVVLSESKLAGLSTAQANQIVAHELGHLLHKEHGVGFNSLEMGMLQDAAKGLDEQSKKLYGYYLAHPDELTAEIVGQALHPSAVTSQGVGAVAFKKAFEPFIENAKTKLDETFPLLDAKHASGSAGLPIPGLGEMAGKPTSIGAYAKALLNQGMSDDDVLTAVKATFPDAKTGMASIKSYKSELKKLDAVGKSGAVVKPVVSASVEQPQPWKPEWSKFGATNTPIDPPGLIVAGDGGSVPLSAYTKIGAKPGGSNPGALYEDAAGGQWLIKGNKQLVDGTYPKEVSDQRARNEVLASKLMAAASPGSSVDMRLVNLGKEYGGGLGVAGKIAKGSKFNVKDAVHLAAAQEDFAIHAWLANHDVVGASFDNLLMVNGKAVNIDPGGAILFRAQGLIKTKFGASADEWETMRQASTNAQSAAVYGQMTAAQLQASAKKLQAMTDDVIESLVAVHGPQSGESSLALTQLLIKRRDDILKRAELTLVQVPSVSELQAKGLFDFGDAPVAGKPGPLGVPVTDEALGNSAQVVQKAVVAPSVAWSKLSAQELVDQLLGGVQTGTFINGKQITGSITASKALKGAMAELFKAGVKTSTVEQALKLKYPSLAQYVPKTTSLASLKSGLKKEGLLDGPVVPVKSGLSGIGADTAPKPKLFGVNLGGKSLSVKDGLKNLIAQGASPQQKLDFVKGQFSTFNPQGAADLIELAEWEFKTGKIGQPGVAALANKVQTVNLPTPVPMRPATTPNQGKPPPPRFTDEGRQAGIAKYGSMDTHGLQAMNARQKAAGLDELKPEEFAALRAYTGSSYRRLNSELRGSGYSANVYLQAYVDAALHGLAKAPKYKGWTNRGMSISAGDLAAVKARYLPGSIVEEHAFTSTSTASGFGGNVRYRVLSQTGVDVSKFSRYPGEMEVLMAPGTRFRIVSVTEGPSRGGYGGNTLEITMEEVEP